MSPQVAELISALVIVAAAIGFDVHCLRDLAQADVVLYAPRQVWWYVIVFSTPFGGIAYLMLGRPR